MDAVLGRQADTRLRPVRLKEGPKLKLRASRNSELFYSREVSLQLHTLCVVLMLGSTLCLGPKDKWVTN